MPATIDFLDLPRFLVCPGSALMLDKADLLMGPQEREQKGEELTLEPFLPITGHAVVDKEPGKVTVSIEGADAQSLTAAALAAHGKYDFMYEFKEYELKSEKDTLALFDLNTIKKAGATLQQQFRQAQQSGQLMPGKQCETCPGAAVCPAIEGPVLDATRQKKFRKETAERTAERLKLVRAWSEAAESALVGLLAQGVKVDGLTLDAGRRAWKDEEKAWSYLSRNVKKPKETLQECRLKSPDDVEAALETAEFSRPIPAGKIRELTKTLPGELTYE